MLGFRSTHVPLKISQAGPYLLCLSKTKIGDSSFVTSCSSLSLWGVCIIIAVTWSREVSSLCSLSSCPLFGILKTLLAICWPPCWPLILWPSLRLHRPITCPLATLRTLLLDQLINARNSWPRQPSFHTYSGKWLDTTCI